MASTGHETMGPYRIVQRLGTGTSTETLLAIAAGPEGFERRVVIKRVIPALEGDPSQRALLAVEASACAHLTHPAILRLYDFFHHEERFALVFEHVDGPPLAWLTKLLRQQGQRLPEPVALFLASRVF